MKKRIAVIGSGFSGLSAAAYAAKEGHDVHVFEKHSIPGGRARQFKTEEGFTFDMGPSWYWMPDVIEKFFTDFGHKSSDFYDLISLNPQFEMVFGKESLVVPEKMADLRNLFEQIEPGAGDKLDKFMSSAKLKYEISMNDFVNKPCHSWMEFASVKIMRSSMKLDLLSNFRKYVRKFFKNEKLRTLMEFPVIFLGASPTEIPALYSLMNYGGYALGTHYPVGGFYELVNGMYQVCKEQGVKFHFDSNVESFDIINGSVHSLQVNGRFETFNAVIASSDYHHTEQLLPEFYRNYSNEYWESRVFAPSCLIYYLGINEKIPNLKHHTLFFDHDLDKHIDAIYDHKRWPEEPLFYVCAPSKTDANVAPENCENLFLLLPLANDLPDSEEQREEYLDLMLNRIEEKTGVSDLVYKIVYKKSYCVSDFKSDYNAYGGNAYGLANTLKQTAVLKPSLKNKKLKNLLYTGQLTVPGPGVPPSIISGKIAASEINKLKTN